VGGVTRRGYQRGDRGDHAFNPCVSRGEDLHVSLGKASNGADEVASHSGNEEWTQCDLHFDEGATFSVFSPLFIGR
jgi:hypothetical protein